MNSGDDSLASRISFLKCHLSYLQLTQSEKPLDSENFYWYLNGVSDYAFGRSYTFGLTDTDDSFARDESLANVFGSGVCRLGVCRLLFHHRSVERPSQYLLLSDLLSRPSWARVYRFSRYLEPGGRSVRRRLWSRTQCRNLLNSRASSDDR